MATEKTAMEKLAFRIAEGVADLLDDDYRAGSPSTEDIYRLVYALLPTDMDAVDRAMMPDLTTEVTTVDADRPPSAIAKLREAVCADKGTPLRVVLEAAISAIEERDVLRSAAGLVPVKHVG